MPRTLHQFRNTHTKGGIITTQEAEQPARLFVFAWSDQKQLGGFNDLLGIVPDLRDAIELIHDHTQNWRQATGSVVKMSLGGLTEIVVGTKRADEWSFVETENQITSR